MSKELDELLSAGGSPTNHDLIHKYMPGLTDKETHDVLWNLTAYPCCDLEHLCGHLAEVRDRLAGGRSLDEQMGDSVREMARL